MEARSRAKTRGIAFTIEPDDVVVPAKCPVLGIEVACAHGGLKSTSPTLDRIDNTKGYVKGNVIVVSWRANRLKSDATIDELRALVSFYEKLL